MEWPPRSGRRGTFPEIDRAAWFAVADARRKILKGQTIFVDRLLEALDPAARAGAALRARRRASPSGAR
jgi:predicted NUDIX family NTP pyrophosphohydrolase